jgi:hypothetical protein
MWRRSNQVRCPVTATFVPTGAAGIVGYFRGALLPAQIEGSVSTFTHVALSRWQRRGARGECQGDPPNTGLPTAISRHGWRWQRPRLENW